MQLKNPGTATDNSTIRQLKWGKRKKKKTINIKNFGRTPGVCVCVCVSHLSRGHVPSVLSYVPSVPRAFRPLNVNLHINRPGSLGRPEFVRGTVPGHSDHQIPLCDFSLSVFCSPYKRGPRKGNWWPHKGNRGPCSRNRAPFRCTKPRSR